MMTSEILYSYFNERDNVTIFSDGTKIRETIDPSKRPSTPESIDFKITDYCDAGCGYCHERSTVDGKHGELDPSFFDGVFPGLEVAIGGGNPLSHPGLKDFLKELRNRGIIPNVTVNAKHLVLPEFQNIVRNLISEKLIFGLGISYVPGLFAKIPDDIRNYENAVIHTILGTVYEKQLDELHGKKILVLGYKNYGRGKDFAKNVIPTFGLSVSSIISKIGKEHLCFDNLAIRQLRLLERLPEETVKTFYMGNDGENTFYVDAVKRTYAITSYKTFSMPLEKNIKECYNKILALTKTNNERD